MDTPTITEGFGYAIRPLTNGSPFSLDEVTCRDDLAAAVEEHFVDRFGQAYTLERTFKSEDSFVARYRSLFPVFTGRQAALLGPHSDGHHYVWLSLPATFADLPDSPPVALPQRERIA